MESKTDLMGFFELKSKSPFFRLSRPLKIEHVRVSTKPLFCFFFSVGAKIKNILLFISLFLTSTAKMGITGLLPFLSKASREAYLNEFAGCTAAVDVYCWIHKVRMMQKSMLPKLSRVLFRAHLVARKNWCLDSKRTATSPTS